MWTILGSPSKVSLFIICRLVLLYQSKIPLYSELGLQCFSFQHCNRKIRVWIIHTDWREEGGIAVDRSIPRCNKNSNLAITKREISIRNGWVLWNEGKKTRWDVIEEKKKEEKKKTIKHCGRPIACLKNWGLIMKCICFIFKNYLFLYLEGKYMRSFKINYDPAH